MQYVGSSRPTRRAVRLRLAHVLAGLALGAPAAHAFDAPDLMAAATYNVLQFVDWPDEADDRRRTRVLCVDGPGDLNRELRRLHGQPLHQRRLEVVELADGPDALKPCHAVFLSVDSRKAPALVTRLSPHEPVLVLAEQHAASAAPMVRLAHEGGFIGFSIDLAATRRAQLHLSSRLLKLARRVIE